MPKRRHSKILERFREKPSKTVENKEDRKQESKRSFKKKINETGNADKFLRNHKRRERESGSNGK
jgi:hypothetical protein